jgi:hypothetical protein
LKGEEKERPGGPLRGVELYTQAFGRPKVASPEVIRALIAQAAGNHAWVKFSLSFLHNEWFEIIDPWLVSSADEYGKVSRLGRKTRLTATQRGALWPIFREVREGLKAQGAVTSAEIFARVGEAMRSGAHPYDFAVVDEAQDLSVAEARFLAALGGDRSNALFFAGDLGRRIFHPIFVEGPWDRCSRALGGEICWGGDGRTNSGG